MSKRPLRPEDRSVYNDGTPTAPVHVLCMPDGTIHLHAAECGDLRKRIYTGNPDLEYDLENPTELRDLRDAIDTVYGPGAGSFYAEQGLPDETGWEDFSSVAKQFACLDLPRDIGGLRWTEAAK